MRRNLALLLAAISTVIWLVVLMCGRYLCRRALAPLITMAHATDEIRGDDRSQRLPAPGTNDELSELGRAFNELLDRLQESFEQQQRFTADASHQLRTPLTVIMGQAEVALRRDRSGEDYRLVLERIQRQAKHLKSVVEALLFLARSDVDTQLLELESIDLGKWLDAYVAEQKNIERYAALTLSRNGERAIASTHRSLLKELFDILLDNANKYSAPRASLLIRLAIENGATRVTVEDKGSGIAPADLPHVFEPFFRSSEVRRRGIGGVGLGLSIARRLAQAFGATSRSPASKGKGPS